MNNKNIKKIISAKWNNIEKTSMDLILLINNNEEIPFTFIPNSNDKSPISIELAQLFKENAFEIENVNEEEYNKKQLEQLSSEARMKRNQLLLETDYLVNGDYPISKSEKTAVKQYRQALRDITSQNEFPYNIEWPTKPDFIN